MNSVCNYVLDPISTMNRGLAVYNADTDATMKKSRYLTKLPEVAYPEPCIQSIKMSQATGPLAFEIFPQRQKSSCTRPQLDMMPDRMSTEYYPVPATLSTAVEPFDRQGSNTRWIAKDNSCYAARYR